jgi:hypothetical protein
VTLSAGSIDDDDSRSAGVKLLADLKTVAMLDGSEGTTYGGAEERRMPAHTVAEDPRRYGVRKIRGPRPRAGSCTTRRRQSASATGR